MTDKVYREAFDRAKADLAAAESRKVRAEADAAAAASESIQLRRTVAALAALCGEDVEDSMGLTEAVRLLFKSRPDWKPMKDVKDQVEALGVSTSGLKNPEASVMSVLNRLVAANELQPGTRKMKTLAGQKYEVKVWRRPITPFDEPPTEPITDDDIPF